MTLRPAGFFVVLAVLLVSGGYARAQSAPAPAPGAAQASPSLTAISRQRAPTHPEHIVLAWYKMAGIQPDFTQWAALSPFLDKAQDSDIASIISRETNRLSKAYTEYDPGQMLVVHTHLGLDDYSTLNNALTFDEFSPKTFFTFSLYGENIAIIPRDIKNFATVPLQKDQMNAILGKTGGSRMVAELILKPTLADAKQPFAHNGLNYKLLLADIAEINFWTDSKVDPQLLWTWRADWYTPKQDTQLLNLKAQGGQ